MSSMVASRRLSGLASLVLASADFFSGSSASRSGSPQPGSPWATKGSLASRSEGEEPLGDDVGRRIWEFEGLHRSWGPRWWDRGCGVPVRTGSVLGAIDDHAATERGLERRSVSWGEAADQGLGREPVEDRHRHPLAERRSGGVISAIRRACGWWRLVGTRRCRSSRRRRGRRRVGSGC